MRENPRMAPGTDQGPSQGHSCSSHSCSVSFMSHLHSKARETEAQTGKVPPPVSARPEQLLPQGLRQKGSALASAPGSQSHARQVRGQGPRSLSLSACVPRCSLSTSGSPGALTRLLTLA